MILVYSLMIPLISLCLLCLGSRVVLRKTRLFGATLCRCSHVFLLAHLFRATGRTQGHSKVQAKILTACWNNSKTRLLGASRFIISYTRRDHVLIHTDHWPGPFPQTLENCMPHELSFSFNHTIFH